MKLPEIKTRHKIRDASICKMWAQDLKTLTDIASHFNLSLSRINAILYSNREYMKDQIDWEKKRRVVWLKRQIKKRGDSKKDSADLQLQLKHELEGEKPLIHIGHNQFFNDIIAKPKLKNRVEAYGD